METQALSLARKRMADGLPERLAWGPLTLSVTNLDRAEQFWTEVLGCGRRPERGSDLSLGTQDRTRVVLSPGATSAVAQGEAGKGHAGMYHVAFGMASQAEFSRRIRRFIDLRVPFSPVDHLMSKALYLSDPDGHGIEIALETPERFGRFSDAGGRFAMYDSDGQQRSGREPLDLRAELALAEGTNPALPLHRDATVAHLHLHVPALEPALDWFEGIGFARNLMLTGFGMADMGAGAPYTHRLAVNIWAGRGARPAPASSARLLGYTLFAADEDILAAARQRLSDTANAGVLAGTDPAGITVTLRLKPTVDQKEKAA